MKTILLRGTMMLAFASISLLATAQAPTLFKAKINGELAKKATVKPVSMNVTSYWTGARVNAISPKAGLKAMYSYPQTLSPLLYALSSDGESFMTLMHYTSFNMKNNVITETAQDYQFLPVGVDENGNGGIPVTYYDESVGATDYSWSAVTSIGEAPEIAASSDGLFYYGKTSGRYSYPTLTVTTGSESNTYTAPGTLNVGKRAEISLSDGAVLGETYNPVYWNLQDNGGLFPGSNTSGFEGYGNIYVFPVEVKLEGVNVYVNADAKAADPANKVKLIIYKFGEKVNGEEIASATLTVAEMNASGLAETGIGLQGGKEFMKVAKFKFAEPVVLDEQLYFITVENIGNDVAGGDGLAIVSDSENVPAESGDVDMLFAHHSYVKAETTTGTMEYFPVETVLGEKGISFFICPIIAATGYEVASISSAEMANNTAKAMVDSEGNIVASSESATQVAVYDTMGTLLYSVNLNGNTVIPTSSWAKGIYMVKFNDQAVVKVAK